MIIQVLRDLGLVDKEPEVFLGLLSIQGVQPASVIAKKCKLNRSTTYKSLLKLAEKGLVTKSMKHGNTAFFIEEPEKRLEKLLSEQHNKLDAINKRLSTALSEIKTLQRYDLIVPKMRVYEGFVGVKRAYEDTVAENNIIRSFENIDKMAPQIKEYMEKEFVPARVAKENFAYVIAPEEQNNIKARKQDKKYLRQARFAPKSALPLETGINIYGKKISFFSYDKDDMFGVILESEAFANSLRAIFDFCWKNSK
jgi:sugar-specific transcriptional regulator TrmB